MPQLFDVSHVSKKGAPMKITISKKAAEAMGLREGDIVGFYEDDGNIVLKKMK